jgi:class 3 adenylate cyclase
MPLRHGILSRFIVKNSSGNEGQMSKRDKQADELKAAIAGLEAQRSLLGDTVVEPALAALRQQLLQLEPPPVDAASDEERKIVTVLFVDVSGFTALSEKLDPEEVRGLINACFEYLVPAAITSD